MKIAVCVDTEFVSQAMEVRHIQKTIQTPEQANNMIIEPSSVAAIQMAKSIAIEGDHLTAITYGGVSHLPALEYALAVGVNSVVRLTDEGDRLANPSDPQSVARNMATWLKKQAFDVIICGNPSGTGLVPALIAGYLDVPCVPRVYEARRKNTADTLELSQRLERGWSQRISAQLPAVITVQAGFFPTKYISVRRRRLAQDNIHTVQNIPSNSELSKHNILQSVEAPRTRAKRTAIPDSTASATDRLQSLIGGIGGGGGFGAAPKAVKPKKEADLGVIETTPNKAAKEIINFLEEKELLPEKLSK